MVGSCKVVACPNEIDQIRRLGLTLRVLGEREMSPGEEMLLVQLEGEIKVFGGQRLKLY